MAPNPSPSKAVCCEAALVIVLTVAVFVVCSVLDVAEKISIWLAEHEAYELDEIVPTLFFFALFILAFSVRRLRESQRQCQQLEAVEKQVHHLAYFDYLTNLPNRALVLDRLKQGMARADRNKETLALVFLDLDHFKTVNDQLGHLVGDELLRSIAQRILPHVRESDTFGRLSGDEFALVLNGVEDKAAIQTLIERVHTQFQTPFTIDRHSLQCTTSMGIAIYPGDATSLSELLSCADRAMYRAKAEGRNSFCYYSPTLDPEKKAQVYVAQGATPAKEAPAVSETESG